MKSDKDHKDQNDNNEDGWEFGDIWKQGMPDAETPGEKIDFVEILRTDTGRGFDDSALLDLVGYLGSRGVRATYDSFSVGLEPAAIKTYVLKVEADKVREAVEHLKEKLKDQNSGSK